MSANAPDPLAGRGSQDRNPVASLAIVRRRPSLSGITPRTLAVHCQEYAVMDSRSAVGQGDGVGGHVMRRGTPAASVMTSSDNAPTRRARRVHRGSALVQCMSEPPTSGAFWVPGPRGPRRPNGMDTLIIQNRPLPVDAPPPPHWGACPAVANPPTSEKKKSSGKKLKSMKEARPLDMCRGTSRASAEWSVAVSATMVVIPGVKPSTHSTTHGDGVVVGQGVVEGHEPTIGPSPLASHHATLGVLF